MQGVRGDIPEPSRVARGQASSRAVVGEFAFSAQAVIVTSGGIGANHELVRKHWPARLGEPPAAMLSGVPDHVDGRMLAITAAAGGRLINPDRMWHYTEGIQNWSPIWSRHGIRILPGPSSLWLDARGRRLPVPLFPGFDTLGTLQHIMSTGYDYSWFVLTQKIIKKEFALSGSEQNPDLTNKSVLQTLSRVVSRAATKPVEAFKRRGVDFIVQRDLAELVRGMNALTAEPLIDLAALEHEIVARDRAIDHTFGKDMQITAIRGTRNYLGDRLVRTAPAAQAARPEGRAADRGAAAHPHAQDAGRAGDRSLGAGARGRRPADPWAVCGGRGGGLRRRRHARLPRAGGNLPGRLHLLGGGWRGGAVNARRRCERVSG